jgi:hypothetical protein
MHIPFNKMRNRRFCSLHNYHTSTVQILLLFFLIIIITALQCFGEEQNRVSIPLPDVDTVLPRVSAKFSSGIIYESSGLVKSRVHDDVYWTHNDSGDSARIYAVDRNGDLILPPRTLSYRGITVHGAENIDWEGITSDNSGNLYIGDIGNNRKNRELFTIYRISEPSPSEVTVVFVEQNIGVFYPDKEDKSRKRKKVNAEALFWAKDHLLIITKEDKARYSDLHALHLEELDEENPLTLIGSFDFRGMVTGADASADGNRLAVLTYKGVWLFEVKEDSIEYFHGAVSWLPIRAGQCEAICFDGNTLVISNEAGRLFKIPVSDLIPLTNQSE